MNEEDRRESATKLGESTRKWLVAAMNSVGKMADQINVLSSQLEDSQRRMAEAERRTEEAQHQSDLNAAKAARTDTLEAACAKLVRALERLPLSMEDAGIIQTVQPLEIPLYGTHEWQAVSAARHNLEAVISKGEQQ